MHIRVNQGLRAGRGMTLATLALTLPFAFSASGCQQTAGATSGSAEASNKVAAAGTTGAANKAGENSTGDKILFRIGYGKGGNFYLMRARGTLEKRLAPLGVKVEWLNFPMGPQMMEAIATNSLELGGAAATPPIFAQAAGCDFVYAANTPPGKSGSGGAILVPIDSPLKSIKDLKGKRIAFQPGSVWQYLLIKALEREGLQYSDIRPAKMPPADATAAFNSHAVDAWVQGEPYITLVQQRKQGRILASTKDIPTSGGFNLASKPFALKHPELLQAAFDEARKTGEWARQNPKEAAALTAQGGGLDSATVEQMIRQQENTEIRAIDEKVVAQQQEQADYLARLGIIPKKVNVRDAVLTPEQYAKIIPPPTATQEANAGAKTVTR